MTQGYTILIMKTAANGQGKRRLAKLRTPGYAVKAFPARLQHGYHHRIAGFKSSYTSTYFFNVSGGLVSSHKREPKAEFSPENMYIAVTDSRGCDADFNFTFLGWVQFYLLY